jgi:hypothetical protein
MFWRAVSGVAVVHVDVYVETPARPISFGMRRVALL